MKLHLGCGKRFIPGFIHVDIDKMDHIDIVTNLNNLSMFRDNSVELIYASHVLEYYSFFEVIDVLIEWNRILMPKGKLRISVPDFDKLISVYHFTNKNIDSIIGPLFGRMPITQSDGSKSLIFHRTVYNKEKISYILKQSGYKEIIEWDWKSTEHSSIDDFSQAYFPHMDKENGLLISLNLEACK